MKKNSAVCWLFAILSIAASERPRCALLFFGLGRLFKDIAFPSIEQNILLANPSCDVFVHTYNVSKVQGGRMGEDGASVIDASEVLLLANRSAVIVETEEEFQRQRDVEYFRPLNPTPSRWSYPSSMDNMIRQWHSIEKVWYKMEMFEECRNIRYDLVGLFRLDVLYSHPISITDGYGVAVIPQMMYAPSPHESCWGGYNDRMFYGKREYAKSWATCRFASVKPYLQWQESNKNYSWRRGLHSEDFLRWLLVIRYPMPLSMRPICFKRIRSSGKIINSDCDLMKVSTMQQHQPNSPTNAKLTLEHPRHTTRVPYSICAIVRTHKGHSNLLPITLLSLTQQTYQGDEISLSTFVVNTDSKDYIDSDFMIAAAADANLKMGKKVVSVLDASFHDYPPDKESFGYDVTDRVLDFLLDKENCTHFLFTNGDNFYVRTLMDWIMPALVKGKQLIAWDFLSHHKRHYNVINVRFARGYVDLGSVLVDRRAIEMKKPHLSFLPEGNRTRDIFARDYFFFKEVYEQVGEENVSVIHQVLFAHQ